MTAFWFSVLLLPELLQVGNAFGHCLAKEISQRNTGNVDKQTKLNLISVVVQVLTGLVIVAPRVQLLKIVIPV